MKFTIGKLGKRRAIALSVIAAMVLGACSESSEVVESDAGEDQTDAEGGDASGDQASDSSSADGDVSLQFTVFSGNEAHHEMLNEMFDEFLANYDAVSSIELAVTPPSDYPQVVAVQLAGGNPPDAGWMPLTQVPSFVGAGALVDVSSELESDPEYEFDDFFESALGPWTRDGAVYGVPFSTSPYFIAYNVDMFEAAGAPLPLDLHAEGNWTWPMLREVAATVQESLPNGQYAFQHFGNAGAPTFDNPFDSLTPLVNAYQGGYWDGDSCLIDDPSTVEAITLYHDMVFEDGTATPPGEISDFYAGQAAMVGAQVSRIAPLADAEFQWDVVPMPAGPDGHNVQFFGQSALSVYSASENVEHAIELVKHLTNKENVLRKTEFFPPARASVLSSEEFLTGHPVLSASQVEMLLSDGTRDGVAFEAPDTWPRIQLATEASWDRMWSPDANISEVASELCAAVEPLL